MFYFISGGVRSGKSAYAEQLARKFAEKSNLIHYIATSIPYDQEMTDRVARHQADRNKQKISYMTYEVPTYLEKVINKFKKGDVILLDCLTTLLSNELFAGWEFGKEQWRDKKNRENIYERLIAVFKKLKEKEVVFIVVSNELLNDVIPNEISTFYYLQMLGKLHQELISICDVAILVEFGEPTYKKGCVEN